MHVALFVHHIARVHGVELVFQRLEGRFVAGGIVGMLDQARDFLRVRVDLVHAIDHVLDLLPGNVLELHAGHRIHEHLVQTRAA